MAVNYEAMTMPQIRDYMNENILVALQIETVRAVELREELLAVEGIDAVIIGPADLSISLGVPGEFQHPKMVETIEAIRDTCVRRQIAPGIQVRTLELAKFWRERGFKLIGCSNDQMMLLDRATQIASALK